MIKECRDVLDTNQLVITEDRFTTEAIAGMGINDRLEGESDFS